MMRLRSEIQGGLASSSSDLKRKAGGSANGHDPKKRVDNRDRTGRKVPKDDRTSRKRASQVTVEEGARKRAAQLERHGIKQERCLCGNIECFPMMKMFVQDEETSDRSGYFTLPNPDQERTKQTPALQRKIEFRETVVRHLGEHGKGKEFEHRVKNANTPLFWARHHLHPEVHALCTEPRPGTLKLPVMVPLELGEEVERAWI
jgi:hypothetical protein